jgi:hypothetical protein
MNRSGNAVVVTAIIVIAALVGCDGGKRVGVEPGQLGRVKLAGWQSYHSARWGYDVSFPAGWYRATHTLTPSISDPVEILSIATFPFRRGQLLCTSTGALARVRPAGALLSIQERGIGAYGGPDFPSRPVRFRPDPRLPGRSEWPYCAAVQPNQRRYKPVRAVPMLDYYFGFSDAGRAFHVLVTIGRKAPAGVRRTAFLILDSLRFDPHVKPGWKSSG